MLAVAAGPPRNSEVSGRIKMAGGRGGGGRGQLARLHCWVAACRISWSGVRSNQSWTFTGLLCCLSRF